MNLEARGYRPKTEENRDGIDRDMLEMFLKDMDFGNQELRSKIKELISSPENFLGKGGAGHVFDTGDQCIKLMKNRHTDQKATSYNLGNTATEEADIQNDLRDLEVNGVLVPRILSFYEGGKVTAIVMERLDAANMQMVVNGSEDLPLNFLGGKVIRSKEDVEDVIQDFYEALEDYVFEMHSQGIVHLDLAPRNIMIDRTTGKPRLIDFGRSKKIAKESKGLSEEEQRLIDKDILDLEKIMDGMEKFLKIQFNITN
jgi:serine/threonine protein kinase